MKEDQRDGSDVGGGQRLRLPRVPDAPTTSREEPAHQVEDRAPTDPVIYRIVSAPTENTPTEVRARQDPSDGSGERKVTPEQGQRGPARLQRWEIIRGQQSKGGRRRDVMLRNATVLMAVRICASRRPAATRTRLGAGLSAALWQPPVVILGSSPAKHISLRSSVLWHCGTSRPFLCCSCSVGLG